MSVPTEVMVNAWTGAAGGHSGSFASKERLLAWSMPPRIDPGKSLTLAADEPDDLRDWGNPRVGWGLILPENENLLESERSTPKDAPEPIQRLWKFRGEGPVFRYRQDLGLGRLRRYDASGAARDPRVVDSGYGTAINQIPVYLLIAASPRQIPWEFQFGLNASCFVGRLDLDDTGLDNYVSALVSNWSNNPGRSTHPVVWSAVNGPKDITALMKRVIADPVAEKLATDADTHTDFAAGRLFEANATCANLIDALRTRRPAFVLTTSHGQTFPLNDNAALAAKLGFLVDSETQTLEPDQLLASWEPGGAVWYAHACCGAGSVSKSQYAGLFPNGGGGLDDLFNAVASLGDITSPFPKRLLSCKNPLRAFISHVEPTFDWTLSDPSTGQGLTSSLSRGLYSGFFRKRPEPVGMAFDSFFNEVGPLFMQWQLIQRDLVRGTLTRADDALKFQLAAMDRSSLVILGDPAVALPSLSSGTP